MSETASSRDRGAKAPALTVTRAQRRWLQQIVDDGGAMDISGLDARPIRRDMVLTLIDRGLVTMGRCGLLYEAVAITPAGRAALQAAAP